MTFFLVSPPIFGGFGGFGLFIPPKSTNLKAEFTLVAGPHLVAESGPHLYAGLTLVSFSQREKEGRQEFPLPLGRPQGGQSEG